MAARTYHSTKVHLLKLVHNILPTRSHTSRFQPSWTNPSCHHCTERDTIDHLQQSTTPFHLDMHSTSKKLWTHISRKHKPHGSSGRCSSTVSVSGSRSAHLHGSKNLHISQSAIGWRLMTRGFLSLQWMTFLHQTLHNDKWRTKHNNIIEFNDKRE
jgi:hypothetical protein